MMHSAARTTTDETIDPVDRFVETWQLQENPPDFAEFIRNHPQLTDRQVADAALADLTFRWRLGIGPSSGRYMDACPQIARTPELKLDIVYGEFRARLQQGRPVDLEEFCQRYPDLAEGLRRQIEAADCLRGNAGIPQPDAVDPETDPRAPLSLDDYELGELLGRGAMGEVYRAWQKSLARPVAIKFLKHRDEQDRQTVERFLREAQTTARLRHPNIVDVRGIGRTSDGRHFLVMDLVEGINLEEKLRQGPLPVAEAVEIAVRVAEALEHAHQCGVVHRDLKPANILIDRQGRVLVTDFGLAKSYDASDPALSMPGYVIGTPQHIAPEQVDRQIGEIGPATDVYGLGSLLYTLLTGQPPYRGKSVLELLMQVSCSKPFPRPSEICPDIPRSVDLACMKCLRRLPDDRYRSAAEVRQALFGAGDTVKASQQPTVAMPVINTPVARRPWFATAAAGVSLLLVVSAFAVWPTVDPNKDRSARRETTPIPGAISPVDVKWTVDVFPDGQVEQRTTLAAYPEGLSDGDMIRLRWDLSRPTYAYVFWIGSDRALQCLYPREGEAERLADRIEIPARQGSALPIEGPAGTELCVVVLRDSRLENPIASFRSFVPKGSTMGDGVEVTLLDGYPISPQPSDDGPLLPADNMLARTLAKLPADTSSRSLGAEQSLRGLSDAESLCRWRDDLPADLGSIHWLAIPHRAGDDSD